MQEALGRKMLTHATSIWHQRISLIAFLISLLIISWLAFSPKPELVLPSFSDKFKHFTAFGYLAYLLDSSFPKRSFGLSKALALLAYGLFIEAVQGFLPNRTLSGLDVLADIGGIICYWAMLPLWQRMPVINWRWQQTN